MMAWFFWHNLCRRFLVRDLVILFLRSESVAFLIGSSLWKVKKFFYITEIEFKNLGFID